MYMKTIKEKKGGKTEIVVKTVTVTKISAESQVHPVYHLDIIVRRVNRIGTIALPLISVLSPTIYSASQFFSNVLYRAERHQKRVSARNESGRKVIKTAKSSLVLWGAEWVWGGVATAGVLTHRHRVYVSSVPKSKQTLLQSAAVHFLLTHAQARTRQARSRRSVTMSWVRSRITRRSISSPAQRPPPAQGGRAESRLSPPLLLLLLDLFCWPGGLFIPFGRTTQLTYI
ncbi:hypothetical protein J6590_060477 [Homalodisca vitripennis]|nr:hypothetical protein J6590_060477 [Homalodisca vitripennis]